jgi:dTDP-4-amino-4,6-dideoxygalactose transaminase
VLTSSDPLAERMRALRNYGSTVKYHHPEIGFNSRLDTLQAVVLIEKLARLERWNAARRDAAQRYDALLSAVDAVRLPRTAAGNEHVFHLYVIRIPRRDDVFARLQRAGIGAGIHYPVPIHLQGAFASLGYQRGAFPNAEGQAESMLSLPLYPQITEAQQVFVVAELVKALHER